jgi:uncharacterized protein YjbJ (UPF0337 family)
MLTDDKSLEAEGQADQAKGDLKDAGEKVKDAFKITSWHARR